MVPCPITLDKTEAADKQERSGWGRTEHAKYDQSKDARGVSPNINCFYNWAIDPTTKEPVGWTKTLPKGRTEMQSPEII